MLTINGAKIHQTTSLWTLGPLSQSTKPQVCHLQVLGLPPSKLILFTHVSGLLTYYFAHQTIEPLEIHQ